MADETVLPTYVYGTHLINQVPIGLHPTPVSLSGLMSTHPIALNAAFASAQKQNVISPTSIAAGSQAMFFPQIHGLESESSAIVPSPLTSNAGSVEWKQATGQKRQRRGSANESMHPTTPTTQTINQEYDWNSPNSDTPTKSTAPPLTPTTAQPVHSLIIPSNILTQAQQSLQLTPTQILTSRPCSTPVTPTGTTPLSLHGEAMWPGLNRQIMMSDPHNSQQSIDYSDGGSDDSPDTPQSKIATGEWPQGHNGSMNTSLPQTPTSTTDVSDPNTPGANDAEGVWSPDIEQAFQEALAIYPPCGRRKIILSDEGKMYGRNELIARYIKLRTGKSRSRKQVSSHIQVLAKKKAREIQGKIKDPIAKDKAMANLSSMSSAQIVSASSIHRPNINIFPTPGLAHSVVPMGHMFTSGPVNPITIKQEPSLMWHPGGHTTLVQQPHGIPTHFQNIAGNMIPISLSLYPTTVGQAIVPPSSAPLESGKATVTSPILTNQSHSPIDGANHLQDRIINQMPQQTAPELSLKLVEFSAFIESQSNQSDTPRKHIFAQITEPNFNDLDMETIDISHIWDKFPEKSGGLKDLYDKGPPQAFFLVKFWGNVNTPLIEETNCFYGVSSRFDGSENRTITCSTKVCSFGTKVVEKVETEYAKFENGSFVYRINRSPMCEYILNFIQRLYHLPENYMMNNVLEHFTILQVVSDRDTQETLLCLAYLFEVNSEENNSKFSLYRLIKGN